MPKRDTIVVIRATDISSDARSQKTVRWLADAGWRVVSISWPRGGVGDPPDWDDVEFIHAPFGGKHGGGFRNLLPLIKWSLFLRKTLRKERERLVAIHAMDLDTAFPARSIARSVNAKFVYDICDFYSISRFPHAPHLLTRFVHWLEMKIVKSSDAVVMPTASRLPLFGDVKPRNLTIIANVPAHSLPALPTTESMPFTIVYVGILSRHRGLCELVRVVANNPEWRLIIGGKGEDSELIKLAAKSADNITFLGKIPYSQVLEWTVRADVLPVTYDPAFPNHKYSSPNKLYEGMMAGVPLVVARNTGVDMDVLSNNLGEVVEYGNEDELDTTLRNIASKSDEERSAFAKRTQDLFATDFSTESMIQRLQTLYADLCGEPE